MSQRMWEGCKISTATYMCLTFSALAGAPTHGRPAPGSALGAHWFHVWSPYLAGNVWNSTRFPGTTCLVRRGAGLFCQQIAEKHGDYLHMVCI